MSVYTAIATWAAKQGWDLNTQLALALEYIDRQQADDAFEDFLAQVAREENEAAQEEITGICSQCGHPVSAHYTALESDGELGDWHPCSCLECGCTAFVESN